MRFIKRLFGGSREEHDRRPLDWLGNDDDAVELGRVEHFDAFLEGLRLVVPEGSILALEGEPAADVREFLEKVRIEPEVRVARGTIWPNQEFFHIPATRENIDRLLELALNHAVPEICDHLVLYQEQQVLVWLHDAGDGYVYGNASMGEGLERLRQRLKQRRQ